MSSMSTTITTPTTAYTTPPATSTDEQGSGPGLTTSASLYLYTFLATLILLLSVSAAIVVRSYLLRRRQRLLIEEAIRNGTYIPPARSPRALGAKPVLYDAYLAFAPPDEHAGSSSRGRDWARLMPVATSLVRSAPPPTPHSPTPAPRHAILQSIHDWWRPPPPPPPPAEPTEAPVPAPPLADLAGDERVRVAVLVAMPRAGPPRHDEGPPAVEFGIAEVPVRA